MLFSLASAAKSCHLTHCFSVSIVVGLGAELESCWFGAHPRWGSCHDGIEGGAGPLRIGVVISWFRWTEGQRIWTKRDLRHENEESREEKRNSIVYVL